VDARFGQILPILRRVLLFLRSASIPLSHTMVFSLLSVYLTLVLYLVTSLGAYPSIGELKGARPRKALSLPANARLFPQNCPTFQQDYLAAKNVTISTI
jgi:hypothetical protein